MRVGKDDDVLKSCSMFWHSGGSISFSRLLSDLYLRTRSRALSLCLPISLLLLHFLLQFHFRTSILSNQSPVIDIIKRTISILRKATDQLAVLGIAVPSSDVVSKVASGLLGAEVDTGL